jgi:hypothetical protein
MVLGWRSVLLSEQLEVTMGEHDAKQTRVQDNKD